MRLQGKIAVVTGGSRGIGYATAMALAQQGCKLAVCSKNAANLRKAEKELKAGGADVLAAACDLAKQADIKKFAEAIRKKFRSVDILVNCAGVGYYKPLLENADSEIKETIDVNITGMILLTKHLLPLVSSSGIIINIASGAGKRGMSGLAAYCASKFAVIGFTESLAGEIAQKVVAVCPGGVDTDMYKNMFGRKPGLKPEHIAAKILEICTEPRKFRSGSSVDVYHLTDALAYLSMKYFRRGKK